MLIITSYNISGLKQNLKLKTNQLTLIFYQLRTLFGHLQLKTAFLSNILR